MQLDFVYLCHMRVFKIVLHFVTRFGFITDMTSRNAICKTNKKIKYTGSVITSMYAMDSIPNSMASITTSCLYKENTR